MIEFLPDALLAVDNKGKVVLWNPAAEKITGIRAEDIIGKSAQEYSLAFPDVECPLLAAAQPDTEQVAAETRVGAREDFLPFFRQGGEDLLTEGFYSYRGLLLWAKGVPLYDTEGGLKGIVHVVRDITAYQESTEILRAQRDLSYALNTNLHPEEALALCMEVFNRIAGAAGSAVYVAEEGSNLPRLLCYRGEFSENLVSAVLERLVPLLSKLANRGKTAYLHCDLLQRDTAEIVQHLGVRLLMVIPLLLDSGEKGWIVSLLKGTDKLPGFKEHALETVVATSSAAVNRMRAAKKLQELYSQLKATFSGTIQALASLAEKRDPYTAGHQARVAQLSVAIAEELGLSEKQRENIYTAAFLHDIGKVDIPSDILNRPGSLSALEMEWVRKHVRTGYEIVKPIPFDPVVTEAILQHHERWNGSGYPAGLKGEEILLEARILAVADVVWRRCLLTALIALLWG